MLSPSEVPVDDSGTLLVMVLLATVLRSAPAMIMGTMMTQSRGRLTANICNIVLVILLVRERAILSHLPATGRTGPSTLPNT